MAVIYSYFLTLASLIFAAGLASRSRYVNRYKNRFYLISVGINAVLLLCEICKNVSERLFLYDFYTFLNVISYGLAPFLPYCIMLMNRKHWQKTEKILMLPAVFIALSAVSSPKTGLLFSVTTSVGYRRGALFGVSLLVSLFYFVLLAVSSYQEYRDADMAEILYLSAIYILVIIGVLAQVFVHEISSMWPTTAIGLLLYYTIILEMSSKYDVLTGVRNRMAFDSCRENLITHRTYAMVICDINGLKPVNDNLGHTQGDILIMTMAKILAKSFYGVGKVYRIGGDEFCVVCEGKDEQKVNSALLALEQNIRKANKNNKHCFSLSYGMEMHPADDVRSSQEIFDAADGKMYWMKQEIYRVNGNMRAGA